MRNPDPRQDYLHATKLFTDGDHAAAAAICESLLAETGHPTPHHTTHPAPHTTPHTRPTAHHHTHTPPHTTHTPDTLHLLGLIKQNQGDTAAAKDLFRRAVSVPTEENENDDENKNKTAPDPNHQLSYAILLRKLGELEQAQTVYNDLLQVHHDHAAAWNNLANVQIDLGRYDKAITATQNAIRIAPALAPAYHNLGRALRHLHRHTESARAFHKATTLNPNDTDSWLGFARACRFAASFDDARLAFDCALKITPPDHPRHTELQREIVILEQQLGDIDLAAARAERLIRTTDDAIDKALLAVTLNYAPHADRREIFEAHLSWAESIEKTITPKTPESLLRTPLTHSHQPPHKTSHHTLHNTPHYPTTTSHTTTLTPASPTSPTPHTATAPTDPPTAHTATAPTGPPASPTDHTTTAATDPTDPPTSPTDHTTTAATDPPTSSAAHTPTTPTAPHTHFDRPLRLGYVSPDFYTHACAAFIEPIIRNHDSNAFEVFCYSNVTHPDTTTDRFRSLAPDTWRDIRTFDDDAFAQAVLSDKIDILVDLAGHTDGNRLTAFARRLAPLQISYLGYPNTTGLSTIDYRLTDAIADPPSAPTPTTERLHRIDGGLSCFRSLWQNEPPNGDTPATQITPPPALQNGHITFGSLTNPAKINEPLLALWAAVLNATPDSRLLLIRHTLCDHVIRRVTDTLTRFGVAADRLLFDDRSTDRDPPITGYRRIDIALDTFPYSGHTTACEALWMGVPIVTLYGDCYAARMAASVLSQADHPEWIADTPERYIAIATDLARDLDTLTELRKTLRPQIQASSLCDARARTAAIESAYRTMWHKLTTPSAS